MPNPSTYFKGRFSSLAAKACIIDTSLPTFAGIASVTPQADGTFLVTWAAATSSKPPVRYEIYVALGNVNAATLFVPGNKVAVATGLVTSWRLGWLSDQVTYFLNGQIYTFGIRAVDAQNFTETNTVVQTSTAIASGNVTGIIQTAATSLAVSAPAIAATEVLLAADHVNFAADHANFQGDHTNFLADHARFQADLTRLETDLTRLETDLTRLEADLTEFEADLAILSPIAAELEAQLIILSAEIVQLEALISQAQSVSGAIARSNLVGTVTDSETVTGTVQDQDTI